MVKSLLDILEIAEHHNVNTVDQLRTFLVHAENNGASVPQVLGLPATDKRYRNHMGQVRKLMKGDLNRNDGLSLLRYGEVLGPNKERAIKMTTYGEWFFNRIKRKL